METIAALTAIVLLVIVYVAGLRAFRWLSGRFMAPAAEALGAIISRERRAFYDAAIRPLEPAKTLLVLGIRLLVLYWMARVVYGFWDHDSGGFNLPDLSLSQAALGRLQNGLLVLAIGLPFLLGAAAWRRYQRNIALLKDTDGTVRPPEGGGSA